MCNFISAWSTEILEVLKYLKPFLLFFLQDIKWSNFNSHCVQLYFILICKFTGVPEKKGRGKVSYKNFITFYLRPRFLLSVDYHVYVYMRVCVYGKEIACCIFKTCYTRHTICIGACLHTSTNIIKILTHFLTYIHDSGRLTRHYRLLCIFS